MNFKVSIRTDEEFVQTVDYGPNAFIPVPNVVETVINPQTSGLGC